jgi:hypothetical protein
MFHRPRGKVYLGSGLDCYRIRFDLIALAFDRLVFN